MTSKNPTTLLLDDVSFDVFARLDEVRPGTDWPLRRFTRRNTRLALLTNLWNGGWPRDVVLGPNPVSHNAFSAYSTRLANLLLLAEPRTGVELIVGDDYDRPDGVGNDLQDVCYDALVDLTRYGGCILYRVGSEMTVMPPTRWYPLRGLDMHVFFVSWRDERDDPMEGTEPTRCSFTVVADGMAVEQTHTYTPGHVGQLIEAPVEYDDVAVEVVPRDPRSGIWGRSKYVDIYSGVLEMARRYSNNSKILDRYSGPIPVFSASDLDTDARFGVVATDTEAEAREKILEGQLGIIEEDTIHLPDSIQNVSYLQPNVQGVTYALTQVTDIREQLRDVTGLPDLSGQTVSGDALKRLFVHFYAESGQMQLQLRLALERVLGQEVEWPHIFDTPLFNEPQEEGGGVQPAEVGDEVTV